MCHYNPIAKLRLLVHLEGQIMAEELPISLISFLVVKLVDILSHVKLLRVVKVVRREYLRIWVGLMV